MEISLWGKTNDDPKGAAWRLDVARALDMTGPLEWEDTIAGKQAATPEIFGDPVIVRKELCSG